MNTAAGQIVTRSTHQIHSKPVPALSDKFQKLCTYSQGPASASNYH